MAEYNFWDDRTHEENDENFCPLLNEHCYTQNCGECEILKEFEKDMKGENYAGEKV